jgi:hypothetical protein
MISKRSGWHEQGALLAQLTSEEILDFFDKAAKTISIRLGLLLGSQACQLRRDLGRRQMQLIAVKTDSCALADRPVQSLQNMMMGATLSITRRQCKASYYKHRAIGSTRVCPGRVCSSQGLWAERRRVKSLEALDALNWSATWPRET